MERILGLAIIFFYGGLALLMIGMHRENFHEKDKKMRYLLGYLLPSLIFIISIVLGVYMNITGKLEGVILLAIYLLIPILIFIYSLQTYLTYKKEKNGESSSR